MPSVVHSFIRLTFFEEETLERHNTLAELDSESNDSIEEPPLEAIGSSLKGLYLEQRRPTTAPVRGDDGSESAGPELPWRVNAASRISTRPPGDSLPSMSSIHPKPTAADRQSGTGLLKSLISSFWHEYRPFNHIRGTGSGTVGGTNVPRRA